MQLPVDYTKLPVGQRKQVREQYVLLQEGLCWYCKMPLSGKPAKKVRGLTINWKLFPPAFLKHPIHLHHDHLTGLTIGAVHAYCNAVLWQYDGE